MEKKHIYFIVGFSSSFANKKKAIENRNNL